METLLLHYQHTWPDAVSVDSQCGQDEITMEDGTIMAVCTEADCVCEHAWIVYSPTPQAAMPYAHGKIT